MGFFIYTIIISSISEPSILFYIIWCCDNDSDMCDKPVTVMIVILLFFFPSTIYYIACDGRLW